MPEARYICIINDVAGRNGMISSFAMRESLPWTDFYIIVSGTLEHRPPMLIAIASRRKGSKEKAEILLKSTARTDTAPPGYFDAREGRTGSGCTRATRRDGLWLLSLLSRNERTSRRQIGVFGMNTRISSPFFLANFTELKYFLNLKSFRRVYII